MQVNREQLLRDIDATIAEIQDEDFHSLLKDPYPYIPTNKFERAEAWLVGMMLRYPSTRLVIKGRIKNLCHSHLDRMYQSIPLDDYVTISMLCAVSDRKTLSGCMHISAGMDKIDYEKAMRFIELYQELAALEGGAPV